MWPRSKQKKPADPDAFPWQQLLVLGLCRFSEPIAFTSIMAYSFLMVMDLGVPERDASFYSGLLLSAYVGGETLTSMGWGMLSDRVGRKPVVLIGLCGVAISSLALGFSKTYWVAFAARLVGGSLNGNVAVMQTMVAEMVKNPAHEPRAFSIQPFVWTFGAIIGTSMGGFLAQPAVWYPGVFAKDGLFGRYPYLLPNLVAVGAVTLAVLIGVVFLEETRVWEEDEFSDDDDDTIVDSSPDSSPVIGGDDDGRKPRLTVVLPVDIADETTPLRPHTRHPGHTPHLKSTEDTAATGGSSRSSSRSDGSSSSRKRSRSRSPPRSPWNKTVVLLGVCIFIYAAHGMASVSLFPTTLLDKPQRTGPGLDLRGGLGFTTHDVGSILAVNGLLEMFIQVVVFPAFVSRMGVWGAFCSCIVLYPSIYLLMPVMSALPKSLVVPGLYVFLAGQDFFGTVLYSVTLILLKDATPSRSQLGVVNGMASTAACLARMISPPLGGVLYGLIGSAGGWMYVFVVALVGTAQVLGIPRMERGVHEEDGVVVAE